MDVGVLSLFLSGQCIEFNIYLLRTPWECYITLDMNGFQLFGVVHLPPLPGSPFGSQSLSSIIDWALKDAHCLWENQFDGLIIENFGDAPFWAEQVEPHTVAQMAVISSAIRDAAPLRFQIGVNVLRNDASAALAVAHAANANFIRVNVHSGSAWTDQGLIHGQARKTLEYRHKLGDTHISIAADILVKHAKPAGVAEPVQIAKDTAKRAGADALIFTGSGTGEPTDLSVLKAVREHIGQTPLWIGSGLNVHNLTKSMEHADAGIIGTYLHHEGDISKPLSHERCEAIQRVRCLGNGSN
ncbi:MAG: BtpA/SgcQ family protein [Myxococcota bacterium]|nr:BtpA/SgcQ family protein [Myxococcota bacterium]